MVKISLIAALLVLFWGPEQRSYAAAMQIAQANPNPAPKRMTRSEIKKLCNKYMRAFDENLKKATPSPLVEKAKILRWEGSNYCRAGRHGKGHLYLQAALMAIGVTPEPNFVIQKAIKEREERNKALKERFQ